jgi:hypothetical protein
MNTQRYTPEFKEEAVRTNTVCDLRKEPSPTWKAFLKSHVNDLVSIDFFIVPTIRFNPSSSWLCKHIRDGRVFILTSPTRLT